jgi:ssRNA-specific RNase YbeY (16S rRNA maturation enzyme)
MKLKQNQQKKPNKQTNKNKAKNKQSKQQANKRHIHVPFVNKEAMSDLNMEHHLCQIYVRITHFKCTRY